jgi:hypothetical protein
MTRPGQVRLQVGRGSNQIEGPSRRQGPRSGGVDTRTKQWPVRPVRDERGAPEGLRKLGRD